MDLLMDLATACKAAHSEKVTERKKQSDKIKLLLNRPDLLFELNKNSREKKRGVLTWDYLFQTAKQVFHQDFALPIKVSDRGQAARRRQDSLSLVRMVIQQAVRGGCFLKTTDLVNLLLDILRNDEMRSVLGAEFTNFIIKELFGVRGYWFNTDSDICHQLMTTYCSLLVNAPVIFDRAVAAKALYAIISGTAQHFDVDGTHLFSHLGKLFGNIDVKERSASAILEYTVRAVNCLSRATAADCRMQVCHLGEQIFVPLLHVWKSKPSDRIKRALITDAVLTGDRLRRSTQLLSMLQGNSDWCQWLCCWINTAVCIDDLVEFYQLQMNYHHPKGAKDSNSGAYAVDWNLWKCQVVKLYDTIYGDFDETQSRSRFSSRDVTPFMLKENIVNLAADVCIQVFSEGVSSIEVTQLAGTSITGGAAKRRRVETGWAALRETITLSGNTLHCVSWLQLLTTIVRRYPHCIPVDEYTATLSSLCQLLADCKLVEITCWLLRCLLAFTESVHSGKHCSQMIEHVENNVTENRQIWTNVYAAACRFLTVYVTQDDSLRLLAKLTGYNLCKLDNEQWSVFHSSGIRPTNAALELLASCLMQCNISEIGASVDRRVTGAHLRSSIMSWLLPSKSENSSFEDFISAPCHLNAQLLAEVSVGLTLRDARSHVQFSSGANTEVSTLFADVEQIYVLSTFDSRMSLRSTVSKAKSPVLPPKAGAVICHLKQTLIDGVLEDTEYAIRNATSELTKIESMAWQSSFNLSVLRCTLRHWKCSSDDTLISRLISQTKALLDLLSNNISAFIVKSGIVQLKQALLYLLDAVNSCCCSLVNVNDCGEVDEIDVTLLATICRNVFPATLVRVLLGEVSEKLKCVEGNASSSLSSSLMNTTSSHHGGASVSMCTLDLDMEFEVNPSSAVESTSNSGGLDDEFAVTDTQSQETISPGSGGASLLLVSALTDAQSCCVIVFHILCRLCHNPSSVTQPSAAVLGTECLELSTIDLLGDLMKLLDPDNGIWNCARPFDLQLLRQAIIHLSTGRQCLNDEAVEVLLAALGETCKVHRKDQEVCEMVIDSISKLVPHLECVGNATEAMTDNRNRAVHMIRIFRKLADKMYNRQTQSAILRCLIEFIMHDTRCEWTVLKTTPVEDNEINPKIELPLALANKHHSIRLLGASAIELLFNESQYEAKEMKSREIQEHVFDDVYKQLQEAMNIEEKQKGNKLQDEKIARTSSVLHALACISRSSPVCRRRALFATLHLTRENSFDVNVVKKMITQVSESVGSSCIGDYLLSYMPYCLNMWLTCNQYKLEEFPWQLCDYSSLQDFYRSNIATLVTSLIWHQKITTVNEIAHSLGKKTSSLLNDCLPNIFIHILPLNAASLDSTAAASVRRQINTAASCYDLLVDQLGKKTMELSIVNNFEEIVIGILTALYDSIAADCDYSEFIRDSDPEPNPPIFSSRVVLATMEYLRKAHHLGTKVNSLVQLLAKSQDGLQQVLLALSAYLSRQQSIQARCRAMVTYSLFVKLVLKDFHTGLGGSSTHVLREIIHVMLSVLRHSTSAWCEVNDRFIDLSSMATDLIFEVVSTAIKHIPQDVAHDVPFIISSLADIISEDDVSTKLLAKLARVINFLVVDCETVLRSAIGLLDPLPNVTALTAACKVVSHPKGSLLVEIRQFLNISRLSGLRNRNRLRGLQHLYTSLANNSDKLQQLINASRGQKESLLASLVCTLVSMTRSLDGISYDEVSAEAGRCLGIIGPVDVGFVILRPLPVENELELALQCMQNDEEMKRYCRIFHALNTHLVNADIGIVQSASETLKNLLATNSGSNFCKLYQTRCSDKIRLLSYLHPFTNTSVKSKAIDSRNQSDGIGSFNSIVNDHLLWNPSGVRYDDWIRTLAYRLIESKAVHNEILSLLASFCRAETSFSELVLPYIVHDILEAGTESHQQVLSKQISRFFNEHCRLYSSVSLKNGSEASKVMCTNIRAVNAMLSIIQYLRNQQKPQSNTSWDNNFWLDLDYLHVAKCALNCSSYFSALLYAEIWCEFQRDEEETMGDSSAGSSNSPLDVIDACKTVSEINVGDLMLEAYRAIGDPDGVYGCGSERLTSTVPRIKMYEHENEWSKAVGSYDLEMAFSPSPSVQVGLVKALKTLGYGHILNTYLQGLGSVHLGDASEIREIQYEAACRMSKWDLDVITRSNDGRCYNQFIYNALVGLKETDRDLVNTSITAARQNTLQQMAVVGEESLRSIYPSLAKLRCIQELESVSLCSFGSESVDEVLKRWESLTGAESDIEFEFCEGILGQRCTLARMSAMNELPNQRSVGQPALFGTLESLAVIARQAGRYNVAEESLCQLKRLSMGTNSLTSCRLRLQEAKLFWARGELETGKHLMKLLIDDIEKEKSDKKMRALMLNCLVSYGDWLAVTRSESPTVVIECYLNKAARMLEQDISKSRDVSIDAFHSLARYVDAQYQHIVDHMNSATYEAKQDLIRQARDDTEKLKKMGETSSRYYRTLEKQRQIDELEQQTLLEGRENYLLCAVDNYSKCLQHSDTFDLVVFRLTSLWFENLDSAVINQRVQKGFEKIGSYKFLPLMYQLAARMSLTKTSFQNVLQKLIEKVVLDHPHHSLGIILSLANANADDVVMQRGKKKPESTRLSRSSQPDNTVEEDRVSAAKLMVNSLKTTKCAQMVKEMESLCNAYIELANVPIDSRVKAETKPIKLPSELLIMKIKNLTNVTVATLETKVDVTGKYENIIYVTGFHSHFTLAGGINLPKIISCTGSDGVARRQLVKGRDDLRQDAVMQQVFNMVNSLLAKSHETRRRCLSVRTYKVVPLSQRSGLLEWCEGTVPMGEYLIGSNGAHQRYRPDDMKAMDCRKRMQKAHAEGNDDDKCKAFREVCRYFQPVFHHFFLEKFPIPADWYERRTAYVRSVATNSMVGYILGLGDRHVQNILIDTKSAELIHIDLGVAFEQGRILPTPETVPFRLTRDIVDGMGIAGVEGVFRRCCEKTMELMHASHEAILTILQVLLYDPLYAWTISPIRAYELQHRHAADQDLADPNMNVTATDLLESSYRRPSSGGNQEAVNKVAERVLIRLRQKLSGLEDGVQLSVTGQVNHLIQAARDPKNLCRLFPGWQPYI